LRVKWKSFCRRMSATDFALIPESHPFDAIGEVPEQFRKRTLAVRGFDASGMMTGWEIVEGTNVEAAIERQFANVEAEYLHIHFAAPGCYAARVHRAGCR
jgi:hypothetical protein